MENNKKNNQSRKIDLTVEKTLNYIGFRWVLASSTEIKAWKAYLVVTFVAGFCAALIWVAYVSWYPIGKAETQVSIFTKTSTGSHKLGDAFTSDILLDSASQNVVAVQVVATYDTSVLQVTNVDTSTSDFNLEVKKSTDASGGKIFIALARSTSGVNSSQGKIATVSMKTLKDINEPALNLQFTAGDVLNSCAAILDDAKGTNVLSKVYYDFPPLADTAPPSVAISSPANNATVSGSVSINVTATDNVGVAKVDFLIDGASKSTSTTSPYSYSWDAKAASNGAHVLSATACDAAGNCSTSANVSVNVGNGTADTTPPAEAITNPQNNATVSGTVQVTASATDNVGVTKVEFLVNDVVRSTTSGSPYSFSWNTATFGNGTHTLAAKAYDAAGNSGVSAKISVNVNNKTQGDTTSLIISNVKATLYKSRRSGNYVVISWRTKKVSTSQVEYGKTSSYGSVTRVDSKKVTRHAVTIIKLQPATTYHYRVISADKAGNTANSEEHTFTVK